MRIKNSMSDRVITFSPRSSGYNFPISWTDLLTTGSQTTMHCHKWLHLCLCVLWWELKSLCHFAWSLFHLGRRGTTSPFLEQICWPLVSSFYKKWNDVFAARHNPHRALLGITPVFHCVHQFWPITLSLELWMYSNRTNFHHTIVGHCSYATKDLSAVFDHPHIL